MSFLANFKSERGQTDIITQKTKPETNKDYE